MLLAEESVSLPLPSLTRPPVPVMAPLSTTSEAVVSESEEAPVATVPLIVRTPLFTASPSVAAELSVRALVSERAVVLLDDSVVPDDIDRPAEPRMLLAPTWIVPALSVVVPVSALLAFVSTRMPAPLFVIEAPDRIELIVAVKPEPTTSEGEPPESVNVPLLSVVLALNVTEFAKAPETVTVAAELKRAALVPPFVEFQGLVPAGVQLVLVASQVVFVAPVQV